MLLCSYTTWHKYYTLLWWDGGNAELVKPLAVGGSEVVGLIKITSRSLAGGCCVLGSDPELMVDGVHGYSGSVGNCVYMYKCASSSTKLSTTESLPFTMPSLSAEGW